MNAEDLEQQLKNEENTKRIYITPVLEKRWGNEANTIVMEYYFTDGRVDIKGNKVKREEPKKADYLLLFKNNIPLALVEAKGIEHDAMEGYQQVIDYSIILDVPFAYTTNGKDLIEVDMISGITNNRLKMEDFPTSEILWGRYVEEKKITEEQLSLINQPYYTDTNGLKPKKPRYYQRIAINRVIEAIASGKKRMLLVMATGTGKTYTAFQIVWRLWKSRTKKKILYLVDRNALADQTMQKDFKPFVDAGIMKKIEASTIKEDSAYEIYTALYQQLKNNEHDYYRELPPDFFDLIIVDECHRGSAADDSTWHEILDYYSSATQIGLTATPKETDDVSNIGYFCSETNGKPIYTYSLKQGIEDGFLAPYRVISVELDIDKTGYKPIRGEIDLFGNPLEDRVYEQKEFDRTIAIDSRRDAVAKKITDFMIENNCRYAKTIVFCENIEHADAMVIKLKNYNSDLVAENPKYIMKITGDDEIGKAELENFTDPNTKYPVIAVTSKLMSTGVDSETCELIVLDKTIGSMTEFKQTIGRGTRIKEKFIIDGQQKSKLHFTILDFRKNYLQFEDPEFDGEPVAVMSVPEKDKFPKPIPQQITENIEKINGRRHYEKAFIKGREVTIENEVVQYRDENGDLVKENLDSCVKNNILSQYATKDEFLNAFSKVENKDVFIKELMLSSEYLLKLKNQFDYPIDNYDLLLFIGYKIPPKSKKERLERIYKSKEFEDMDTQLQVVMKTILNEYLKQDYSYLKNPQTFNLPVLNELGYTPLKLKKEVFDDSIENYIILMNKFEKILYEEV